MEKAFDISCSPLRYLQESYASPRPPIYSIGLSILPRITDRIFSSDLST